MAYRNKYSPAAIDHIKFLTDRRQNIVVDGIDEQLIHNPGAETRNRKPMRPNPIAPWELRIGNLRVYYDIEDSPEPVGVILAVGIKTRNQVRIGNKVFEL